MTPEIIRLINALRAAYTDARGTKLDNLDATVSSRAASATALSNVQWTAGRAGYLDLINTNLDAKVSSAGLAAKPPLTILNGLSFIRANLASMVSTNDTTVTTATETAYNTWKTIKTVSGEGWIDLLAVYQNAAGNTSSMDVKASLLIDGVEVWVSDIAAWATATTDDGKGFVLVAPTDSNLLTGSARYTNGRIYFKTSWTLRFMKTENAAGTVTMACKAVWATTA